MDTSGAKFDSAGTEKKQWHTPLIEIINKDAIKGVKNGAFPESSSPPGAFFS